MFGRGFDGPALAHFGALPSQVRVNFPEQHLVPVELFSLGPEPLAPRSETLDGLRTSQ